MELILPLVLISGLILWLGLWIFYKTLLWTVKPLTQYMEERAEERFAVEDFEAGSDKDKVQIILKDLDRSVYLPKDIYEKAQTEPQNIPDTTLWIYKDSISKNKPSVF